MLQEENLPKLDEVKENDKAIYFEKVAYISRIIQVFTVLLIVLTAMVRFFSWINYASVTTFMLTINLLVFAAILILVEFRMANADITFYFLNFSWGKALSYLFFGLLLMFDGAYQGNELHVLWWDKMVAIYFFVMTVAFLVTYCLCREDESAYV